VVEPPQPKKLLDYIIETNLNEFELYDTYNVSSSIKFDVLDWWKTHEKTFPTLSLLAKKILSAATSVPSERLFSKCGELVTKKRSRLSVSTVRERDYLFAFKHALDPPTQEI